VGHEDLLVVKRYLDSSTPRREVFPINNIQIVSSHDLDQRAWSVQLVQDTQPAPEPDGRLATVIPFGIFDADAEADRWS